ncbi:hypothetical protein J6590_008497 [Homalodisca vitripennis]|nr:hypothetical protein J6590_008497 [Homalodisca vitripennis]
MVKKRETLERGSSEYYIVVRSTELHMFDFDTDIKRIQFRMRESGLYQGARRTVERCSSFLHTAARSIHVDGLTNATSRNNIVKINKHAQQARIKKGTHESYRWTEKELRWMVTRDAGKC